MPFIDEKGRVFGKINIMDLLVILFLFFLIPMFYFGYKIMTKKPPEGPPKEFVVFEADYQLIKIKPEELQYISSGDKELDEEGKVIGQIVRLGDVEPYQYAVDVGGSEKIIQESEHLKQAIARLKLRVEKREEKLYYKNILVELGLPLEFKTKKVVLTALLSPESVEKEALKSKIQKRLIEKTVDLSVILKGLDEHTLKEISTGDKEADQNGRVIAEILSLGKMENNTYECRLSSSTFVTAEDSSRKQISAKMRLRCLLENHGTEGNQLYFKDTPIERNKPFLFKTANYKVSAVVTQTFENPSLEEKHVLLEVKFSGVIPEVAKIVQKGDTEKDALGKTVAVISDVVSNKPSDVLAIKGDTFITLNHPFQRDILLSLDVTCVEKEGVYYYKNSPVKMGNNIVFNAELYSLGGVIVGLQIK